MVLSILASSCTWTGSNPAYNKFELSRHLAESGARYLVTPIELLETALSAIRLVTIEVEIILLTDLLVEDVAPELYAKIEQLGIRTLHHLVSLLQPHSITDQSLRRSAESFAAIMPTSGTTTGTPKMIRRSHRSFIAESQAIEDSDAAKPYEVRCLYCTPIYHAFSFPDIVVNSLRLGQTSFIQKAFGHSFVQNIKRFAITETLATPSMLQALEKQVLAYGMQECIQSLRLVVYGGTQLSSNLAERFKLLFKYPPRIVPAWGMTECGRISTLHYPEVDDTGSVGRAVEGLEVCLDLKGPTFLIGGQQVAELLVRGPQITNGCKDRAQDDTEWFRTGDTGYVCGGKVFLIDRIKDIIKVDGWSVAPSEIEEALSSMPGVVDVAAIGDGRGVDEHAVIFLVASNDRCITVAQMRKHLLGRISSFKLARCEVRHVDHIPRDEKGKILRSVLRKWYLTQ